jgi:hypothetical protein
MLDSGKFLPGANTLAYLALLLATKKKSFITLTPDANVLKLFLFATYNEAK